MSCATPATQPVVHGKRLRAGTHLDLVGAFKASMRETDDDALPRAVGFALEDLAAAGAVFGAALAEGCAAPAEAPVP